MARRKAKALTEEEDLLGGFGEDDGSETLASPSIDSNVKPAKIEKPITKMQFHLCSWCGGTKHVVSVTEPDYVENIKVLLPIKKRTAANKAKYVVACVNCTYKLYNTVLGQAQYYGVEKEKALGVQPRAGYFPTRY